METYLIALIVVAVLLVIVAIWYLFSSPSWVGVPLYIVSPYGQGWDNFGSIIATYGHYDGVKQQFMLDGWGGLKSLYNGMYVVPRPDGKLGFATANMTGVNWSFNGKTILLNGNTIGWTPSTTGSMESGYPLASGGQIMGWEVRDSKNIKI